MVKIMVSCRFSLKPIHGIFQFWVKTENQPLDGKPRGRMSRHKAWTCLNVSYPIGLGAACEPDVSAVAIAHDCVPWTHTDVQICIQPGYDINNGLNEH